MKYVIDKVCPLEQALRWNSGQVTFLQMLFAKMAQEIAEEQSKINVTEGHYRLRIELDIERSSLNPDKRA
jgi:hypothetical protein